MTEADRDVGAEEPLGQVRVGTADRRIRDADAHVLGAERLARGMSTTPITPRVFSSGSRRLPILVTATVLIRLSVERGVMRERVSRRRR